MKKYFIFLLFIMSFDIYASPWVKKKDSIYIVNSFSIYIPPNNYENYEFSKELILLNKKLLNIAGDNNFSEAVKEDRRKVVRSKINKLDKLREQKFFYDRFSNSSYIEYSYSDDLAISGNIFLHNKYQKSNEYFGAIYAKYKIFEKNDYIFSLVGGGSYGGELEFLAGISAGHSWGYKDIDYFTYLEPLVSFNYSIKEFKIDYTNGMKFKNNCMVIFQTIYKGDAYKSEWSEKISIVKTWEIKGCDLSIEFGGVVSGRDKKAIIFSVGVLG